MVMKNIEEIISYIEREIEISEYYKHEDPANIWGTMAFSGASQVLNELLKFIKGYGEDNKDSYQLMLKLKNNEI